MLASCRFSAVASAHVRESATSESPTGFLALRHSWRLPVVLVLVLGAAAAQGNGRRVRRLRTPAGTGRTVGAFGGTSRDVVWPRRSRRASGSRIH